MSKDLTNTHVGDYNADELEKADIQFVVDQVLRSIKMGHAECSWKIHDHRVTDVKVTQNFRNKI